MTSGLFASYEEDFLERAGRVRAALVAAGALEEPLDRDDASHKRFPDVATMTRRQQSQVVQQGIAHLRNLLTSMSYESNDITPVAAKDDAKRRVEECRHVLLGLERGVSRLQQEQSDTDKTNLVTDGAPTTPDEATQRWRAQMLAITKELSHGTATLQKVEAVLHSTCDAGTSTLSNLRTQTETMQHFHTVIHDVDVEVSESRRIVNRMQQTAVKHKLWLAGIIVGLLLVILGVFALH